jgi:hypothetical protein
MKVAAHELRALNLVVESNVYGLNVPLFAVIDYNGCRIIAEVSTQLRVARMHHPLTFLLSLCVLVVSLAMYECVLIEVH